MTVRLVAIENCTSPSSQSRNSLLLCFPVQPRGSFSVKVLVPTRSMERFFGFRFERRAEAEIDEQGLKEGESLISVDEAKETEGIKRNMEAEGEGTEIAKSKEERIEIWRDEGTGEVERF